MKVIDLLNKIANGEIDEETRYKFSPFDYCTIKEFFNRYIVDEENLNLEIVDKEDKDIPLIPDDELYEFNMRNKLLDLDKMNYNFKVLQEKINQVVEELNKRQ